MEFKEALQQLRERLDDSLIHHAKMTQRDNIGELYKLQAYSETHYYMKAVHDYTSAEVEALLSFIDPLEVAFWCREENTHSVGLPICDILKEIHADERFEKIEPDLSLEDKTSRLIARLELNLFHYLEDIKQLTDTDVMKYAENIAATMASYRYTTDRLMSDSLDDSMIDFLYKLDNPLRFITDRWPECSLYGEHVLSDLQKEIDSQGEDLSKLESVHERLKDARRKAADQPKPTRENTARKDKESR